MYEWLEYLKQAQESQQNRTYDTHNLVEILGRFIQASARLERVVYSAMKKYYPSEDISRRRVYSVEELYKLGFIDERTLQELIDLRSLRNRAVHTTHIEEVPISVEQINRLDQIVDEIEKKL